MRPKGAGQGGYNSIQIGEASHPGPPDDMEVDAEAGRARWRATAWAVSVQPHSSKPASYRQCALVFSNGQARLCIYRARTSARWECIDCMRGCIPANVEFHAVGEATQEMADAAGQQVQSEPEEHRLPLPADGDAEHACVQRRAPRRRIRLYTHLGTSCSFLTPSGGMDWRGRTP